MDETTIPSVTGHRGVDKTLNSLLTNLVQILGDDLFGLYLYGSLATGDFHSASSDIDFLAVTRKKLTADEIQAIRKLHAQLFGSASKWNKRLEGSYMPLDDLPAHLPPQGPYASINEGKFYIENPGSQWVIHRDTLLRHGVTVYGPSVKNYIKPVSDTQLKNAQANVLKEKWVPRSQDVDFFNSAEDVSYAVLTMARALYLFEHGSVASKLKAAQWAAKNLDPKWRTLIQQAIETRGTQAFDKTDLAKEFIEYTLEQSVAYTQP